MVCPKPRQFSAEHNPTIPGSCAPPVPTQPQRSETSALAPQTDHTERGISETQILDTILEYMAFFITLKLSEQINTIYLSFFGGVKYIFVI